MMASRRHSHKKHSGKRQKICSSIPASSFCPFFVTRVAGLIIAQYKFVMWPIGGGL